MKWGSNRKKAECWNPVKANGKRSSTSQDKTMQESDTPEEFTESEVNVEDYGVDKQLSKQ